MIWLKINKSSDVSLTRQVYEELRTKILNKELVAGEKLPSTRNLSLDLAVSRNIILDAYEQLIAEGYLESFGGSGTFVASGFSFDKYIDYYSNDNKIQSQVNNKDTDIIDFISGTPDLSLFPKIQWAKCLKDACLDASFDSLNYTSSAGLIELRISISKLLLKIKGLKSKPENIVILSGSAEGFLILSKLLGDKYNNAMIEDPSYNGIKKILQKMNIGLLPIATDDKGMITELLPSGGKNNFIIVTPSHHFPLGGVLPIQRRIKLIEYARNNGIYIIENDYDSEFRYSGYPISSIHMLDPSRVIHIGTFSESMYPGIRLGYMILPEDLVKNGKRIKGSMGLTTPTIDQIALSYFIKRGNYEKHINKMKKLYIRKREALINILKEIFREKVRISGDSTGLYVIAEFEGLEFTEELIDKIYRNKAIVYPVEEHAIIKGNHLNKLIMGYGNLKFEEISEGAKRLKKALMGRKK